VANLAPAGVNLAPVVEYGRVMAALRTLSREVAFRHAAALDPDAAEVPNALRLTILRSLPYLKRGHAEHLAHARQQAAEAQATGTVMPSLPER
jgi:hypothetical protein